jgi:short subunit dehydrogenase-like uncharacterized protein
MAARIVLFGATGYTGALVAEALVERGARPVLAGRSEERLAALAGRLGGGLETARADVADPPSVRALVQRGDVLVSTVGPFTRFGAPAVEAALDAGAHYLDCTGESAFIRRVFDEWGPRAREAGVVLLTAMGYDWAPGHAAAGLALREAGDAAVRVDVGYFVTGRGGFSAGTRASAAGVVLDPAHAFRDGRVVLEPPGRRLRTFQAGGRPREALSAGATEPLALPRTFPQLREVGVYLGWFGPLSRPLQAANLGLALATRLPGARAALDAALARLAPGSGGGPDAAARARAGSLVVADAIGADRRRLAHVELRGVEPYTFTAGMLAWSAIEAREGRLAGAGALGPVEALGLERLLEGVADAGLEPADGEPGRAAAGVGGW